MHDDGPAGCDCSSAQRELLDALRDLTAELRRHRLGRAKSRKPVKAGARRGSPKPPLPGPPPSDLDVRRAQKLLRDNGWHDDG